jgi:hypothetical protein
MDAHFAEYLAAIEGMRETYGEREDSFPTEYHDDTVPAVEPAAAVAGDSHWDA